MKLWGSLTKYQSRVINAAMGGLVSHLGGIFHLQLFPATETQIAPCIYKRFVGKILSPARQKSSPTMAVSYPGPLSVSRQ